VKWIGVSRELWIGVLILFAGLVLYVYRRIVQDKLPFVWRDLSDDVPHTPEPVPAAVD
jgi:hypothetical protein